MNFTPSQETAAGHRTGPMMVLAGAGAGKTGVLAERCARLVAEGPDPCGVSELLVVTFTREAAAQMRSRIAAALRNKAARPGRHSGPESRAFSRLQREAALVDQAQICTFDSFCAWLVKTYFAECGVDPVFSVLEEREGKLMLADAIRETVRQWLGRPDEPQSTAGFAEIFDIYANSSVERMQRLIDPIVRILQSMSLTDGQAWAAKAAGETTDAADFIACYRKQLDQLAADIDAALDNATFAADSKRYMPTGLRQARETAQAAAHILRKRGVDGWDEAAIVLREMPFARSIALAKAAPDHAAAKDFKQTHYEIRKRQFKTIAAEMAGYPLEELRRDQREAQKTVHTLLDFTRDCLAAYARAKQAIHKLDFADLEQRAVAALAKHDGTLAARIRTRFRHILVDEYQDINPLQQRLVDLLAGRTEGKENSRRSFFGVGDVHQSIYAFRGGEPGLLDERSAVLEESGAGRVVRLAENFRSLPPLIAALNEICIPLFRQVAPVDGPADPVPARRIPMAGGTLLLPGRPAAPQTAGVFSGAPVELHVIVREDKKDEPRWPAGPEGGPSATMGGADQSRGEPLVSTADENEDHGGNGSSVATEQSDPAGEEPDTDDALAELDNNQREARLIAHSIQTMFVQKRLICQSDGRTRVLKPTDIAILLRATRSHAGQFVRTLAQHGVPAVAELRTGFFESQEVLETLELLKVLDNPAQDIALAGVLLGPFGDCTHEELRRIRQAFPDHRQTPFYRAVELFARSRPVASAMADIRSADMELAQKVRRILDQIQNWRRIVHTLGVAAGLDQVFEQSGLLLRVLGETHGRRRLANLQLLHRRAVEFAGFSAQDLSRFAAFIQQVKESEDWGEAPPADVNAVRVMSIHAAKGLESSVVFVAGLGRKFNIKDLYGYILVSRPGGIAVKIHNPQMRMFRETVSYQLTRKQNWQRLLEEEARLLYVAMTRARDHLVLIGHAKQTKVEQWREYGQSIESEVDRGDKGEPRTCQPTVNQALDWLGPIFSPRQSRVEGAEPLLRLTLHQPEDLVCSPAPSSGGDGAMNHILQRMRNLEPLELPPSAAALSPDEVELRRTLCEIEKPYCFEPLTRVPAVTTISRLKMRPEDGDPETPAAALDPCDIGQEITLLDSGEPAEGIVRGLTMHRVLERLNLAGTLTPDDIHKQIAGLVATGVLTAEEATLVDVPAIAWLWSTPLGRRMRNAARRKPADDESQGAVLKREVMFLWTLPAGELSAPADAVAGGFAELAGGGSEDIGDRVVVRGTIDALLLRNNALHVLDYKTDRAEMIESRLPVYIRQVRYYARAAAAILRRPATGGTLVFLTARRLESVEVGQME